MSFLEIFYDSKKRKWDMINVGFVLCIISSFLIALSGMYPLLLIPTGGLAILMIFSKKTETTDYYYTILKRQIAKNGKHNWKIYWNGEFQVKASSVQKSEANIKYVAGVNIYLIPKAFVTKFNKKKRIVELVADDCVFISNNTYEYQRYSTNVTDPETHNLITNLLYRLDKFMVMTDVRLDMVEDIAMVRFTNQDQNLNNLLGDEPEQIERNLQKIFDKETKA